MCINFTPTLSSIVMVQWKNDYIWKVTILLEIHPISSLNHVFFLSFSEKHGICSTPAYVHICHFHLISVLRIIGSLPVPPVPTSQPRFKTHPNRQVTGQLMGLVGHQEACHGGSPFEALFKKGTLFGWLGCFLGMNYYPVIFRDHNKPRYVGFLWNQPV